MAHFVKGVFRFSPFVYFRNSKSFKLSYRRQFTQHKFSSPYKPLCLLGISLPFFKKKEEDPHTLSPDEQLRSLMKKAVIHIYNEELQEANTTLHNLLNTLQQLFDQGQFTEREFVGKRARIYSEMANLGLLSKEFPEAEKLLKSCIQDCLSAGLTEDNPTVLELSLKLALLYEQMGENSKAYAGFQFALDRHERKIKRLKDSNELQDEEDATNDQGLLGMILAYYAKFLHHHHQTPIAMEYMQRALDIARKLYGSAHANVVSLLNDLAVMQISAAQWKQAEQSLREGIHLCEDAPSGGLLASLVPLYVNMAHLIVEKYINEESDGSDDEKIMQSVSRWCEQAQAVASNAELKGLLCQEAGECLEHARNRLASRPNSNEKLKESKS